MARAVKNLNEKGSEYIEANFLSHSPEGLEPLKEPERVVVTSHIPKMEKVVFLNQRDPGLPLTFHYASKTHPLKHYTLYHGKEEVLSAEIIEHLESCAIPIYGYRRNYVGDSEMYVSSYRHLYNLRRVRS